MHNTTELNMVDSDTDIKADDVYAIVNFEANYAYRRYYFEFTRVFFLEYSG